MVAQFSILNRTGFWSNFTFRSKLHKNPRCAPYLLSPTKMNIVGFHNGEVSPLAIRKTDPCWIMRHAWCHPRVNVIHPLDIAKHYSNIPKQIIIFHCKNTKLWPWVENKFIDWLACFASKHVFVLRKMCHACNLYLQIQKNTGSESYRSVMINRGKSLWCA